MGKFGEPIERRTSDSTVRAYGGHLVIATSGNEHTDRIVETYNALEGIDDPGAFMMAARDVAKHSPPRSFLADPIMGEAIARLRSMLPAEDDE
jgi:hypothetical protein